MDAKRFAATGSGYDRPEPVFDADLTLVGRGTPMGELLRRYWHPVYVADRVKDLPVKVRALGEDLVLFRKPGGEFGLVHNRCAHRGTSLFYGKVSEAGIRCCYHGWTFDTDGRCVDQPTEVARGGKAREKIRQPWYPVQVRYGLVFAYLGPPDKKPELPYFDVLEEKVPGWEVVGGDHTVNPEGQYPCNWLQHHENTLDGAHVQIVHADQFPPEFATTAFTGTFKRLERSILGLGDLEFNGNRMLFDAELFFPLTRAIPDELLQLTMPDGRGHRIWWTLPVDDTTMDMFTAHNQPIGYPVPKFDFFKGKTWDQLTPEEHQRMPGDREAQVGQGAITLHSEEHLTPCDAGIVMYRRMLREGLEDIKKGKDPLGAYGSDTMIKVSARIKIEPAVTP